MLIFCWVCMCSSLTDMGLRHATCWLEGGIRNIPITPLLSCQPALQHWKFKHWLRHKTNDRFYNWSPDNQWSSHNLIASTLLLSNMKGIQFVKKTSTAIPKGCYIYCGIAAMSAITMYFPPYSTVLMSFFTVPMAPYFFTIIAAVTAVTVVLPNSSWPCHCIQTSMLTAQCKDKI